MEIDGSHQRVITVKNFYRQILRLPAASNLAFFPPNRPSHSDENLRSDYWMVCR
jgi:hypothetical protein